MHTSPVFHTGTALGGLGLTTADAIEQRATEALGGYVRGLEMLRLNLRDALAIARQVESKKAAAQRV
jgi:hypothetical protein